MQLDDINVREFLKEILEIDRQDSENFHENFISVLVKYGFSANLTSEEISWYEDNKNGYCQNISEYTLF